MYYTKFDTNDGIEFTPIEKPEQIENIDIECQTQNISNSELTNTTTICCICLENNDLSSTQLNCRCKARLHIKCIEEMRKNKIKKCPLCSDTIVSKKSIKLNNFIIIIIIILFFTFIVELFLIMNLIFYPSERKYCDNVYRKCEFYKVNGILINNTMSIDVKNFIPEYKLISTYEYGENENCINMDYHIYTSYEDIRTVKEKTSNINTDIFVSYLDKSKCKYNYRYYNPIMFYTRLFSIIHLIVMIVCCLFTSATKYMSDNNYNINFITLLDIFGFVSYIGLVMSTFISFYYILISSYNSL